MCICARNGVTCCTQFVQTDVHCRHSAVAMLACLPDAAALSFLLDHAVSGTLTVQEHFAAMYSREINCRVVPSKLRECDSRAIPHRAISASRACARVLPSLVRSQHVFPVLCCKLQLGASCARKLVSTRAVIRNSVGAHALAFHVVEELADRA